MLFQLLCFAGGDKWSFFYRDEAKEVEVKFNPGDMLIYDGPKYTHWRKPFKKKNCVTNIFTLQ